MKFSTFLDIRSIRSVYSQKKNALSTLLLNSSVSILRNVVILISTSIIVPQIKLHYRTLWQIAPDSPPSDSLDVNLNVKIRIAPFQLNTGRNFVSKYGTIPYSK